MTNLHASGFVFGTTLLLLLMVINICSAPLAAAAACGDRSEAMLFNSSSLEFAEELAKDHEIRGRVLQGRLKFLNIRPFEGIKPPNKVFKEFKDKLDIAKDIPGYFNDLKDYLDKNFCILPYCYPSDDPDYCICKAEEDVPRIKGDPCTSQRPLFYCCVGEDATCSTCCEGKEGKRDILNVTTSQTSPPSYEVPSSISSSHSPIAYYVVVLVMIQGLALIKISN